MMYSIDYKAYTLMGGIQEYSSLKPPCFDNVAYVLHTCINR